MNMGRGRNPSSSGAEFPDGPDGESIGIGLSQPVASSPMGSVNSALDPRPIESRRTTAEFGMGWPHDEAWSRDQDQEALGGVGRPIA